MWCVGWRLQTTRVGVDASLAPKLKEAFRNLIYAPQGVLFEDASVMIGVQSQYNGAAGRMMLHFRNRAAVCAAGVLVCRSSLLSGATRALRFLGDYGAVGDSGPSDGVQDSDSSPNSAQSGGAAHTVLCRAWSCWL